MGSCGRRGDSCDTRAVNACLVCVALLGWRKSKLFPFEVHTNQQWEHAHLHEELNAVFIMLISFTGNGTKVLMIHRVSSPITMPLMKEPMTLLWTM